MAYTTINKSTDYFNTKLYSGNDTNGHAITGVGFQPDWTWIKCRTHTEDHNLYDAVRGAQKSLVPNSTQVEGDYSTVLQSFNTDGFTVGTSGWVNDNGKTYASWNWKANGAGSANTDGSINSTATSANTTTGFSIVKYTGNQTSGATVGHGLGAVPKMIIVKNLNDTENWVVYHASLGNTKRLSLNLTEEETTDSAVWNNTTPTSSVFSLGNSDKSNNVNIPYIAYCFAEKKGYSKFGSYVGNGNADGTFVYTGFKPAFVMVKRSSGTDNWMITDNKRSSSGGNNAIDRRILPNLSNAEYTNTSPMDILSNGFKHRDGDDINNASGSTYIYMAFGQSIVGSNNIPATAR
jgi:hypothetical protein